MRNARTIREKQPLTLEEVSSKTSIRFSHLSRFERNRAELSIEKLQELARLYGCTIDDLVAEAEPAEA